MLRAICVFAGSTPGVDPRLLDVAREAGADLARRGIGVVFGGGGAGLMGALADGVLGAGGEAVGVIPGFMVEREWGRDDLTEQHVVATMHERKALMAERSDAFLVLPGGIGTLEELFEVWTWRQIGLHGKPVGLLDAHGFWGPLVAALDHLVDAGFVSRASRDDLLVAPDLDTLLDGPDGLVRRTTAPRTLRPGS